MTATDPRPAARGALTPGPIGFGASPAAVAAGRAHPLDPVACRDLVASHRWTSRVADAAGGCWLIDLATTNGYPRIWIDGRMIRAGRVALVAKLGRDIQAGYQVGHACHDRAHAAGDCVASRANPCRHRRCVNPAHLVEQSPRDNILSGGTTAAQLVRRAIRHLRRD